MHSPPPGLLPGLALARSAGKDPEGCLKLGSDCLYAYGFRIYCTPLPGFFSPFPHGTGSLSVISEYLALERGRPGFPLGYSSPVVLRISIQQARVLSPTGLSPSVAGLSRPFC